MKYAEARTALRNAGLWTTGDGYKQDLQGPQNLAILLADNSTHKIKIIDGMVDDEEVNKFIKEHGK